MQTQAPVSRTSDLNAPERGCSGLNASQQLPTPCSGLTSEGLGCREAVVVLVSGYQPVSCDKSVICAQRTEGPVVGCVVVANLLVNRKFIDGEVVCVQGHASGNRQRLLFCATSYRLELEPRRFAVRCP